MIRQRIALFISLIAAGLASLMNNLTNPRLSGLHTLDRVQLIASGLCFGVALGVLVGIISFRATRD